MIDFKYVTENNYDQLLKNSDKPIMIYFWTLWSSDCKREEIALNKTKERFRDAIEYFAVNLDECPNLRERLNINIVPTVMFYKNCDYTAKEIGLKSEAIYYSHVSRLLGDNN